MSVGLRSIGRAGRLAVVLAATFAVMATAAASGPVATAQAGGNFFCYTQVAPYGHAGDRCYAQVGGYLTLTQAYGYSRSACSNAWLTNHGLVTNWACAPIGTWSNSYFDGSRYLHGVVRNNNQNHSTQIWGYQEYL